ncbi:MAG: isoprenylcysteine carboxylmethyltransferase family protein [Clostridia bacterium]|nr:isoprenylcysteine carboxylmethyltransferase family protein [Clostridia bacterium]
MRWVNQYALDGRIPGAERLGRSWAIPEDAAAQRPDGRLDQHREPVDVRRAADHDEKGKGDTGMKNYIKKGQKLPLYGVGPAIVFGMGAVTAIGIILFAYVWKIGFLETPWVLLCRMAGVLLIGLGLAVWFIGALRSDMDASIAENRLQTGGIYAWMRNPMYSGWWMLFAGICLQWHNVWALATVPVNWMILTVTLKLTEEKWLLNLYGQDYADYLKRVHRCIPWPPRKA